MLSALTKYFFKMSFWNTLNFSCPYFFIVVINKLSSLYISCFVSPWREVLASLCFSLIFSCLYSFAIRLKFTQKKFTLSNARAIWQAYQISMYFCFRADSHFYSMSLQYLLFCFPKTLLEPTSSARITY